MMDDNVIEVIVWRKRYSNIDGFYIEYCFINCLLEIFCYFIEGIFIFWKMFLMISWIFKVVGYE